jgi:sugar phosphate permease
VTWFPPYERGTATAISILFSSIGSGIAFILGKIALIFQHISAAILFYLTATVIITEKNTYFSNK